MAQRSSFSYQQFPRLVNVSVDDQHGDLTTGLVPEYLPSDGTVWHVGSPTEDCPTCNIKPSTLDLDQIYDQTWHDGTNYPPGPPATITVQFTGSAVYVFNILPNTLIDTDTYTNISFSIDGEDAASFIHTPNSRSTILYNQLVYQNATLQHGLHTLVMSAAGNSSLILFDYLLYTTQTNDTTPTLITIINNSTQYSSFNTPSTYMATTRTSTPSASSRPTSSTTPIGAVVGGVVGGLSLLLWVATGVLILHRRRASPKHPQNPVGYANITSVISVTPTRSSPPGLNIRSLDGPSTETEPVPRSDVSGPETPPSLPSAAEAAGSRSTTATWAKSCMKAELVGAEWTSDSSGAGGGDRWAPERARHPADERAVGRGTAPCLRGVMSSSSTVPRKGGCPHNCKSPVSAPAGSRTKLWYLVLSYSEAAGRWCLKGVGDMMTAAARCDRLVCDAVQLPVAGNLGTWPRRWIHVEVSDRIRGCFTGRKDLMGTRTRKGGTHRPRGVGDFVGQPLPTMRRKEDLSGRLGFGVKCR
ncbi:hypothetical protein V8D89_007109 [Ganoderma adspersum]